MTIRYEMQGNRGAPATESLPRWGRLALGIALSIACVSGSALAQRPTATLDVLHWWTSASEQRAFEVLREAAGDAGVRLRDASIPGGAGTGALKVLRARVLRGEPPSVAQINGASMAAWARLGFLRNLDVVAQAQDWQGTLPPVIDELVRHEGRYVAAPFAVHRVNTLLYNRRVFARLGLDAPTDWESLVATAQALKAAGVTPIAQSAQPWQVATLLEVLVLARGGTAFYRRVFVDLDARALRQPAFTDSLRRLRRLRAFMGPELRERPWQSVTADVAEGRAAMQIMGDWAKGELLAMGKHLGEDFGCRAAPGTDGAHLYSIDTMAFFKGLEPTGRNAQSRLAGVVLTPRVQRAFSRAKGTFPARRDIADEVLDACARGSRRAFHREPAPAPSLVHRMATTETVRNVFISEVHRFFTAGEADADATARRLAAALEAIDHDP